MSGIVGSKDNIRGSGLVAKLGTDGQVMTSAGAGVSAVYEDAAGGGLDWQSVVTGSTLTAVAGNGYPINTTSNTCTITLPGSASAGDQIIFVDYARTWGTYKIILDSNGLNYQGQDDTYTVEYNTDGETVNIVYVDATKGWIPLDDDAVTEAPSPPQTQKAIFAYGGNGGYQSISNLVNSSGVVATDTVGVGTARSELGAAGYGDDKAIFAYGTTGSRVSTSNLVTNLGVVGTDVTGVGTMRSGLAAARYGTDKAIFGFGSAVDGVGTKVSTTNLVTNAGVVGADVTGVGTGRSAPAAAGYGTDKAIFGFGHDGSNWVSTTNLVNSSGVAGTDVSGVGTIRAALAAAGYGTDKAIFAYGSASGYVSISNLVNSSGVVASDTVGVGTARNGLGAAAYGGDKAIFAYGNTGSVTAISNLVNSSGVVASDVVGVGTAREGSAAAGYSLSA